MENKEFKKLKSDIEKGYGYIQELKSYVYFFNLAIKQCEKTKQFLLEEEIYEEIRGIDEIILEHQGDIAKLNNQIDQIKPLIKKFKKRMKNIMKGEYKKITKL